MRIRNAITLYGVLVVLSTLAPREGRANSGFIETVGISTAVGTVLGASTLPFYSVPGDHLINLAIGAGAGFVTGLGIWVFNRMSGASPEIRSESKENLLASFDPQRELAQKASLSRYTHVPYPKAPTKGLLGQPLWMPIVQFQLSP